MKTGQKVAIGAGVAGAILLARRAWAAPPTDDIILEDLVISPLEVYPGEVVAINCLATNIGDITGSRQVRLEIDGVTIQTKTVTLNPGQSSIVNFTTNSSVLGVHAVDCDNLSGSFVVVESPEANFEVTNLVIDPTEVYPSESVNISCVVTNVGDVAGTYTVVCVVT